jgi:diguanylate cyclase (GGDEF)-like protein/PAS domain S-box-containing protein
MRRTVYLLIPVMLFVLTMLHLQEVRITNERQYLNYETRLQSLAMSTSLQRYRVALHMFFNETIQRPEIASLIASAVSAEGMERQRLRALLHEQLGPAYARLQQLGIEQLQIHTEDGHSFLRFHEPDRYGDYLLPYRPSLGVVRRQGEPLFLFEVGRLFIGFRHVEPVTDNGRLVASVEAGVSFDQVRELLIENDPGTVYRFLLRRDPVEAVVLDFYRQQRSQLSPSAFGANYLMLDQMPTQGAELAGVGFTALAQQLQQPALEGSLAKELPFTLGFAIDAQYFTSTFIPVHDVDGALAAWVVAFSPSSLLKSIYDDYYSDLSIGAVMLLVVTTLLLILASKHNALSRQTQRMDAISAAVGEGIFVIDPERRAAYVNQSACELTGYSEAQLMASDIHDLIHAHPHTAADPCPILSTMATGEPHTGDEQFLRADGEVMDVAVTSRAMREKGQITGVVTVFRDITERKRLEQRLAHMATIDELTGLMNRRALVSVIENEIRRLHRSHEPSVLMMIDFDHFKEVNDTYGHDAGDRVLRHFAEIARECLRESDSLGRLGGEEFAVLLPDTPLAGALTLAERLRMAVEAAETRCDDRLSIRITLSIGLCQLSRDDHTASDALRRVDKALYRAKALGRNRVEVA